jgi:hypothetical protein
VSSLIGAISSFISKVMTLTVVGSILVLAAGEIRLAALKKASGMAKTYLITLTERLQSLEIQGGRLFL